MGKKLAAAVLAMLPFAAVPYFSRQHNSYAQEQFVNSSLPHYLQDIAQPADRIDQIIEESRVIDANAQLFGRSTFSNGSIEEKIAIHGKEVVIIFHNYVRQDGHIRYTDSNGFHILSDDEFKLVRDDIVNSLTIATSEAYAEHSQLSERIIAIQQEHLQRTGRFDASQRLEDLLDQPVSNYEGLTIADALGIPRLCITDFVPAQFHYGPLPRSILGVTYINIEIVGYHPLARQIDFVNRAPNILKHELVHNCRKLQGIPLVYEFDAEFHASMISKDNALWFLRHQYLEDSRQLAKVLFSFDAERVFNHALPFTLMTGSSLKREVLERYVRQIDEIRDTIRRTYLDEFLPEFYTHLTFWTAVNEELNDRNAAFKVFMWSRFHPTLLRGPENTYRWLQQNRQVIEEASRKALEAARNKDSEESSIVVFRSLPREEQEAFVSFLRTLGVSDDEDLRSVLDAIDRLEDRGVFERLRLHR